MILTLTPNPSLDLLFEAGRLRWDDANRIPMPRRRPGGQGVNLVRAVRELAPDVSTLAVLPLGGAVGSELREMLRSEGTPLRVVEMTDETRVFVGVRERDTGRSLLLNPRGTKVDSVVEARLLEAVAAGLAGHTGGWVACCGSLLPGLSHDLYARVGALAAERGFRFVPDCDGPSLAAAVASAPSLLVPNAHEAGRLVGRPVDGVGAAVAAARELIGRAAPSPDVGPPERVLVTLGAEGAVAVDPAGAWWARPVLPPPLALEAEGGSAVGAGDAFLAALLLALDRGAGTEAALGEAVATGTATLLGRGADLVRAADLTRVRPHVEVERVGGP